MRDAVKTNEAHLQDLLTAVSRMHLAAGQQIDRMRFKRLSPSDCGQ